MANFFGEIFKRAGDLVSHPVKISKDLVTKPSKGWKELTHLYTYNEHKDQDLFQKGFGIHGWIGDHPQESAAAVVATIFGGWAAMGAYGGTAAGGAGATTAGASGAAGATGAGGSGIAAGTVIGQTVPATPGMIAAANGGGAAIGTGANAVSAGYAATAGSGTSYSILAGSGYGVGGAYPTTLGGEATVGNTGLTSGTSWGQKAKQYYDYYQKVNQLSNMGQQQPQQQEPQPLAQPDYGFNREPAQVFNAPAIPLTTSQLLNGIGLNANQNNVPSFTTGGTFGGFKQ